jgi:hypothetical protein
MLRTGVSRFDCWSLSVIVVTTVDVLNFLELQRSNSRFMTTLDVLIAIPAIPFAFMVITWWLPWERIPWGRLPKLVLGPYVLYTGFAAWHFHFSDWFVLVVIAAGVILTITGAVEEAPAILPSTTDNKFLKTLEDWLRGQQEIMILIRYSRAAGSKSFEFFTSFAALREVLRRSCNWQPHGSYQRYDTRRRRTNQSRR